MTYDVTIFGLHFTIKPVAFTLPWGNGWDIYWYGIIIAVGFLAALVYAFKNASRYGIDSDRMIDVILVSTPVSILCARAYYLIFDGDGIKGFSQFFGFDDSSGFAGLAIYGSVIGAFVCGALMCKIRKIKILDMFDIASVGFLIGQGIGRWGNFINQEAYGTFTGSSWWGMQSNRTVSEMGAGLVHPCFLYESVWCIAGFFILNHFSKKRRYSGQMILMYCAWYGFGRTFIELLRTDSLMIGNIKVSCLLSVLLCVAASAALVIMHTRLKKAVIDTGYNNLFEESDENEETENGQTD